MQQPVGDLQDAFSKLNINIPTTEEENDQCLLPQWKDITQFLDEAMQELDVGRLIHLQSFTLFDAMSAIEVMDPRMDTGMLIETEPDRFDIYKRIESAQVLGIIDRLVTCEMAWISGHSLSQTVYTCIYFHHTQSLNELPMPTLTSSMPDILFGILKTYILSTVKCCHYIWTEMTQGNVFEEEDFTTNLFGLSFNDQNPNVVMFNDIDLCIMLLNHLLNVEKAGDRLSDKDREIVKTILNRMELRKSFLLSLVYLSQNEGSHLMQAKSELEKMIRLLKEVNLSLGTSYEDAFDPNINRKLTSQTPPRPVKLATEEESFQEFALLINRLLYVCNLMDYPSVNSFVNYFIAFGSKKPYPDALSRSKLNTLLFRNQRIFGTIPVSQFIQRSISETVGPPPWWLHKDAFIPKSVDRKRFAEAHSALEAHLDRISTAFVEYFKINCHNRSRQRRMLCKFVSEWEILQEESAVVDEIFHQLLPSNNSDGEEEEERSFNAPYYFSSWAYNIKLTMIEKILFLGFELELYDPREYAMVYWYTQCVLNGRSFLLNRIVNNVSQDNEMADQAYSYLETQQLMTHGKKSLSEALLKILLTAKHTKQWDQKEGIFDDEETRYLHRFKSFSQLASPVHPTYQTYLETVSVQYFDVPKMLLVIEDDLLEAKKMLDQVLKMSDRETSTETCNSYYTEDIKNLVRTSVANKIALKRISNDLKDSDKKSMIDAQFKYHSWFPIII